VTTIGRLFKGLAGHRAALPGSPGAWRAGIWQRRYWEHLIRDEQDYRSHLDYLHFNPVTHGHAKRVADWPHSTFHAWVARGGYSLDWAGSDLADALGEME